MTMPGEIALTALPAARFYVDFPSGSPLMSQWCTRDEAVRLMVRYGGQGATMYLHLPLAWQEGDEIRWATHGEMADAMQRGIK